MADCYYHGYSGGSGPCGYCAIEVANGIPQGEGEGSYVKDRQDAAVKDRTAASLEDKDYPEWVQDFAKRRWRNLTDEERERFLGYVNEYAAKRGHPAPFIAPSEEKT